MATNSLDSNPKSFKIDRRSPEASDLRAVISKKLFDYLGSYSDDVLAEYIVVLVCNGKNQIQARNDLEEFLGKESENFVIWLWDHLSKQTIASGPASSDYNTDLKSTHVNSEAKAQGISRHHCDTEASDFPCPKEHVKFSNFSMDSNLSKIADGSERFHYSMDTSSYKEKAKRIEVKSLVVNEKIGAKEDEDCDRGQISMNSVLRQSSRNLPGDDKCQKFERQHQKITKSNPGALPYRSLRIPREELIARNSQIDTRENTASRPVFITSAAAMDVEESMINRPRGSVWDRLGRPVDKDYTQLREENHRLNNKSSNNRDIRHQTEDLRGSISNALEQDTQLSGELINCKSDEQGFAGDFDKSKRKRQYGIVDSGKSSATLPESGEEVQDQCSKKQDSGSFRYLNHQKADVFVSEMKGNTAREHLRAAKSFNSEPTRSIRVDPAQVDEKSTLGILHQGSSSTHKTGAHLMLKGADKNNTCTPTGNVMLDVKEKLLQVERDMVKLRAKQADISNSKNIGLAGSQKNLEDEVDSRTVLVTNVHFAASREALSNYFMKCGPIAKVTMLNDPVTSQPKGAAYIVFTSKDSADKAISFSGTSFFSRLLKVMRKAEAPRGFLLSTQVVRPQQSSYPQLHQKGFLQRHQMSSHLQWKRNDSSSKEDSLSACADGLQSSSSGK